ncbi:hypothetical protein [Pleurocapsa sp. FMAR1]|uniref:hypothetical protein n=1 Tax=Pleurocapsa sp. FMAR1 TaxID=3040204 RepID=UPI0029C93136|nr:hypothetical protein [Pleurocapsa sp. FMAR1]
MNQDITFELMALLNRNINVELMFVSVLKKLTALRVQQLLMWEAPTASSISACEAAFPLAKTALLYYK